MISLKKYLDSAPSTPSVKSRVGSDADDLASMAVAAYAAALVEMGRSAAEASPATLIELKQKLEQFSANLLFKRCCSELIASRQEVQDELQAWARRTSAHHRQQAEEVKQMLLAMTRAAEAVGTRDRRSASQIQQVSLRLQQIATLENLTEIRASIHKSAADLKVSIERMTQEGNQLVEDLRRQVSSYRARLEEAEQIASRDGLTGVRSRLNVETQIEIRIASGTRFCVALLDIDDFKLVNDDYGHTIGDELLKQFAGELCSICRSTDIVGRWGGDEFILLLDCDLEEACGQRDRLRNWVSGDYTIQRGEGVVKLGLSISIGVAQYRPGETIKQMLSRADEAMYEDKGASRAGSNCTSW
jgi:diguanylate cyclase (GGDEF)-like protein